jgi:hypothetical protein
MISNANGAATFCMVTLSGMTFYVFIFSRMKPNRKEQTVTLHNAAIRLSIVRLSVVRLSVVRLNVVAPR